MPAARTSSQTGLKRLAGALVFVCVALLALTIEPRLAAQAFQSARDAAAPAVERAWAWSRETVARAGQAAPDLPRVWPVTRDSTPSDIVLSGQHQAADDATRTATGAATFTGAQVRFEIGGALRTAPLRIAAASDAIFAGRTFAQTLGVAPTTQIELRRIVPADRARAVEPSALCGGAVPTVLAVRHAGRQVDLMLFSGAGPGPDAPPTLLCGHWRYRA